MVQKVEQFGDNSISWQVCNLYYQKSHFWPKKEQICLELQLLNSVFLTDFYLLDLAPIANLWRLKTSHRQNWRWAVDEGYDAHVGEQCYND